MEQPSMVKNHWVKDWWELPKGKIQTDFKINICPLPLKWNNQALCASWCDTRNSTAPPMKYSCPRTKSNVIKGLGLNSSLNQCVDFESWCEQMNCWHFGAKW